MTAMILHNKYEYSRSLIIDPIMEATTPRRQPSLEPARFWKITYGQARNFLVNFLLGIEAVQSVDWHIQDALCFGNRCDMRMYFVDIDDNAATKVALAAASG